MEFPHGHPLMRDDVRQFFLDAVAINKIVVAIKIKVANKTFQMITHINEEILSSFDLRDTNKRDGMICVAGIQTIKKN